MRPNLGKPCFSKKGSVRERILNVMFRQAFCYLIALYEVFVQFSPLVLTRVCACVEGFGGPGIKSRSPRFLVLL